MDFSDVYNFDVRVKKEPDDVSPIKNEDYKIIDNACDDKNDEFSSFCRENLIYGLRENDENSGPNNDLEIEFECKDEKLGINLLVVKKMEDDYPDQWQHMKNSCDYQTQKKIKEEIVDEVKEELNLDGELSDAFDANEKTFAQNSQRKTQTDKARNRTKYPCNICSKKFARKGNLKVHIDGVHNGVKHACGLCAKTFKHKGTLKIHIDAMHNGMAHTCEVCGKKFLTKTKLKIHIDGLTLKRSTKTLITLVFYAEKNLNIENIYADTSKVCMKAIPKHEINTNDLKTFERYYKCPSKNQKLHVLQVWKGFGSKRDLDRHVTAVHQKIKDYKCEECGKPLKIRVI
ncbi:gastrula zinc finger protein xFG20-1-like [Trichogramma pretiosum]|uniref:gastrula zinc finger protein xFG20-1-like n=1 Tax=Trichogramma pretiosum TaxID=7493 RepID=UPI000C71AA4B|nr:gastrula zinc finger protein xFG20-1-like [Trichogramma pretiosum]